MALSARVDHIEQISEIVEIVMPSTQVGWGCAPASPAIRASWVGLNLLNSMLSLTLCLHVRVTTLICNRYARMFFLRCRLPFLGQHRSALSQRCPLQYGVGVAQSTTGCTFTPCVGSFTSPGIDTMQIEWTDVCFGSNPKYAVKVWQTKLSFETTVHMGLALII